jgi:hypothetical protein
VNVDEIVERSRTLESEKQALQIQHRQLKAPIRGNKDIEQIVKAITEFFNGFDLHFQKAPLSVRKALIQNFVDRIDVNRERNVARCYLLSLSKGSGNILDQMIENERTHLKEVSPTGFGPVFSP